MVDQARTHAQGTLEFKMNKQMEIFSFPPAINLSEEGKWLLAVSSFGATNSAFKITHENISFPITIPGYWSPRGGAESINSTKFIEA